MLGVPKGEGSVSAPLLIVHDNGYEKDWKVTGRLLEGGAPTWLEEHMDSRLGHHRAQRLSCLIALMLVMHILS